MTEPESTTKEAAAEVAEGCAYVGVRGCLMGLSMLVASWALVVGLVWLTLRIFQ